MAHYIAYRPPQKVAQVVTQLAEYGPPGAVGGIPWGHNVVLVQKVTTFRPCWRTSSRRFRRCNSSRTWAGNGKDTRCEASRFPVGGDVNGKDTAERTRTASLAVSRLAKTHKVLNNL